MNSPWPLHFSASRTRLTPGMLTMMSYRSLFLLAAFCWIGEVIWASVTRFGKILQLRPKCKNLWRTFQCLFSGRQTLETTLAKKHVWVNGQILKIILPPCHTETSSFAWNFQKQVINIGHDSKIWINVCAPFLELWRSLKPQLLYIPDCFPPFNKNLIS